MKRLLLVVPLATEQSKAASYLMNSDGLCTCGRLLHGSDAKFILCNAGPAESPFPERRNTLVMAAYCYDCFAKINATLTNCNGAAYRQKRSEAELRG